MDYVPHTPRETSEMLEAIGVESLDALFDGIPEKFRRPPAPAPDGMSELEVMEHMTSLAAKNLPPKLSFLGASRYDHYIPAVVDVLANRGEFLTAYTPYQAEASQGNLQAIFEYQSLICELTALDVSNASHYDGATALAEAIGMAVDQTDRETVLISRLVHPLWRQVVATYFRERKIRLEEIPDQDGQTMLSEAERRLGPQVAAVVIQNPNFFGVVEEIDRLAAAARRAGAVPILACDPISLGILKPPGEAGFEIAVGDGQGLGTPVFYGGPSFGFLAARGHFLRRIPGRIVGETVDREGKRGFVMTLQAREQHIRREKAGSNICTNQALVALRAAIYLCAMGKEGLPEVARLCLWKTRYLADRLGTRVPFRAPFFREVVARLPERERLESKGIFAGVPLEPFFPEWKDHVLLAVTEKTSRADIDRLVDELK